MAAESYPTWVGGQDITADLLNSMLPKVMRKTADETRTSTTTTTQDAELFMPVEANAVYVWHGWLKYGGNAAGDIAVDFTVPTGALGEWAAHGVGEPVIGASAAPALQTDTAGIRGYMLRTETNDVDQFRTYGVITGSTLSIILYGTLRTSSTAGTFALTWAQGTSSASATTLYTDSWLSVQRIA